ncbi:hypothetical protein J437_LFUL013017 [Ladona fulva]|uniref:Uncharacterized protein n=1 Tax=Ladona fulva TaxID=123851 RepID=A0A8K0P8T4_LADFU|nr:hypothetical protein J437_LFUL013017 [Ladona fulva]
MQHIGKGVIKSMRNTYGSTQTAVVYLLRELATKALEIGKIQICWRVSHTRAKVLGLRTYSSNMCRIRQVKATPNVWVEGYLASACTNHLSCVLCGRKGDKAHHPGSYMCPSKALGAIPQRRI